jgi:hypothetical protein
MLYKPRVRLRSAWTEGRVPCVDEVCVFRKRVTVMEGRFHGSGEYKTVEELES